MSRGYLREVLHRHASTFEVVTDYGSGFKKHFEQLTQNWGLNHIRVGPKNPQANGLVERTVQVVKSCLRKCAHSHPKKWHPHLTGIAYDLRTTHHDTIQMSPFQCLYGRSPVLAIELTNFPTRHGLIRPDLNRPERPEERAARLAAITENQSMAKAQILGASIVQRKNFAQWHAHRKTRTSELKKGDWVLMRRPGTIRGHRFRWEGPYAFQGWLPGMTDRKGVLKDRTGLTWARTSREIFKYFPRIEFVREYLQEVSLVDGVRPVPKLMLTRFLENDFVLPPFLSLRLEQAILKVRKLHGFTPLRRRATQ